ncbi:WD40 repeat domain-containing protein [Stieleria varia]|nr:hypothetical protein [Stieleria varia]
MTKSIRPFLFIVCLVGCLAAFGAARSCHAAQPPITAIVFAPSSDDANSGELVGVSQAGVHRWSWPDLKPRPVLSSSLVNLHCLAFSPDGNRLAVGGGSPSEDGRVEVFRWHDAGLTTSKGEQIDRVSHDDTIHAIAWMDSQTVLTGSLDRSIASTRADLTEPSQMLRGHSRGVLALAVLHPIPPSTDKLLISAGEDQCVRVWSLDSWQMIRNLNQHTGVVRALALRPIDSGLPMLASASADRTIRFWQPTIGRMMRYIRLDSEPLDIAWTIDSKHLVAACLDGQVRVIDPDSVRVVQALPALSGWAYAIAAHPTDGSFAIAGADGQVRRIVVSD